MEALEAASLLVPLSQARQLTEELIKRFPVMEARDRGPRQPWARWTDEEYAQLVKWYQEGMSRKELGERLGKSDGQINGAITRLKLLRKDGSGEVVAEETS
jgi:hypothetical protein